MSIVGTGSNLDPDYQLELEDQYNQLEKERARQKMSAISPFSVEEGDLEKCHQRAYFQWCAIACLFGVSMANDPRSYTEEGFAMSSGCQSSDREKLLKWVYAITLNQSGGIAGLKAREMGAKAGMSDTGLDVKGPDYSGYSGFRMEFKRSSERNRLRGGLSQKQVEWKNHYTEQGYYFCVAFSWREAVFEVCKYLDID